MNPTQEQVRALFDYKDGQLLWKEDQPRGRGKKGDRAGILYTSANFKYRRISIKGVAHRSAYLVWLYHTGEFPRRLIIKDGDRLNDRIENLELDERPSLKVARDEVPGPWPYERCPYPRDLYEQANQLWRMRA